MRAHPIKKSHTRPWWGWVGKNDDDDDNKAKMFAAHRRIRRNLGPDLDTLFYCLGQLDNLQLRVWIHFTLASLDADPVLSFQFCSGESGFLEGRKISKCSFQPVFASRMNTANWN